MIPSGIPVPLQQALDILTPEEQENDLKSNFIKLIDAFKEETNEYLKEIQKNAINQIAFKEEIY